MDKERKEWLESMGYATKETDYFLDVARDRIELDKAYAKVNNTLIEQIETLTEEQIESYISQKEHLEKFIIYYYMLDKGWKTTDKHTYIKEDSN